MSIRFEARLVHPDGSWIQIRDSYDSQAEPIVGDTIDQICEILLGEPFYWPTPWHFTKSALVIVKIETTEIKPNQKILDLMRRD